MLTAEELTTMSNAELSELVAMQVMGWRKPEDPDLPPGWMSYYKEEDRYTWAGCRYSELPDGQDAYGQPEPNWAVRFVGPLWCPVDNWGQMKLVIEAMRERLFSIRRRFAIELHNLMRIEGGERMAWPDAVLFMTPRHVCIAAVLAVTKKGEGDG
jgi:hypothetical protein